MTLVDPARRCRRAGCERGQATVEFVLVLPFVLLLVVGLVQVARVSVLQIGVVDAARAGARAASVEPDEAVARAAAGVGSSPGEMTVEVMVTDGSPRLVTVHVVRSVRVMPGLGWSAVELSASSTMAVEDAA